MSRTPHPIHDRVWLQHPIGVRVQTTTRYRYALVTVVSTESGRELRITRSSNTLQTLTDLLVRFNQHRQPVIFDTHTQEKVGSTMNITRTPSTPFPQESTFGPGLMETWRLTSWVKPNHDRMVRLVGTYPVYCGMGNSHSHPLDIRASLADVRIALPSDILLDSHSVAIQLAEWAMEDYPGCECDPS